MNKYKSLIIIMFFIFAFSISKVYANVNDFSLLGKVIYLDAGHGGIDVGAEAKNIKEKDINLILVKKLEKILTSKGAKVYLTSVMKKETVGELAEYIDKIGRR